MGTVVSGTGGIKNPLWSWARVDESTQAEGSPVFQHNKQTLRIILPCSIYKRLQASAALNKHLGVLARPPSAKRRNPFSSPRLKTEMQLCLRPPHLMWNEKISTPYSFAGYSFIRRINFTQWCCNSFQQLKCLFRKFKETRSIIIHKVIVILL